jgi:hypothetical protein
MRLTDEILKASDDATAETIGKALMLATAGRFGLFPCSRPFEISLNITKESIHVESLNCLAVTKGGHLIDVVYDTRYSNFFETQVRIPDNLGEDELFLVLNIHPDQWEETHEGFEEHTYDFSLVTANSPIADNALPLAHLVDSDYGSWHIDEVDFVPPCLFVSSHPRFEDLLARFQEALVNVDAKTRSMIHSQGRDAICFFWPIIQQIRITVDKERDLLTPMALLGLVQKFVCAFTTACELDEHLTLSDAESFRNYAFAPYNYRDVYKRIREGLDICFSITDKIGKMEIREEPPAPKPSRPNTMAPFISEDQLYQNCRYKTVKIPVINPVSGATVYYSTNGGEPKQKLAPGTPLSIENKFNTKKVPEPDQTIEIKLKAVLNGSSSEVNSFMVTFHKDYKVWEGYEI